MDTTKYFDITSFYYKSVKCIFNLGNAKYVGYVPCAIFRNVDSAQPKAIQFFVRMAHIFYYKIGCECHYGKHMNKRMMLCPGLLQYIGTNKWYKFIKSSGRSGVELQCRWLVHEGRITSHMLPELYRSKLLSKLLLELWRDWGRISINAESTNHTP